MSLLRHEHFQLPKLPLPDVPKTMDRLLDAIRAVEQDAGRVEQVEREVGRFQADEALVNEISQFLEQRAEKEENWVRMKERFFTCV